jgi:hypothetical protein
VTRATLIRLTAPGSIMYAAVAPADALGLLASFTNPASGADAQTVPWDTLPGVEALAVMELAGRPPMTVAAVGTVEAGEWATWNPPCARPPVPEADR